MPMLQKLGSRIPDVYMEVMWNPGGQTVILKRSMTIGYVKESDYMWKAPQTNEKSRKYDWNTTPYPPSDTVREVTKTSH